MVRGPLEIVSNIVFFFWGRTSIALTAFSKSACLAGAKISNIAGAQDPRHLCVRLLNALVLQMALLRPGEGTGREAGQGSGGDHWRLILVGLQEEGGWEEPAKLRWTPS